MVLWLRAEGNLRMYTKILPCILKLKAEKLIQAGLMLPLRQQILLEEFSLLVFLRLCYLQIVYMLKMWLELFCFLLFSLLVQISLRVCCCEKKLLVPWYMFDILGEISYAHLLLGINWCSNKGVKLSMGKISVLFFLEVEICNPGLSIYPLPTVNSHWKCYSLEEESIDSFFQTGQR